MIIAAEYSFNGGKEAVTKKYPLLLDEVVRSIKAIDASHYRTKESSEKTMLGKMLYSPVGLNGAFKRELGGLGWRNHKIRCEYPTHYYTADHTPKELNGGAFRDMDFVKSKLGIEVQFGKYAFMVYNVCAKMTIFHKLGVIDTGIEIVPIKEFADEMSTGVSYFEQFAWDLSARGTSDIDIPVYILGIHA